MPRAQTTIKSLVQGFASHSQALKAPDYKESQARLHYIDPFWELLGWDVSNHAQAAPQDVEVLIEPSMDSADDDGLRSRAPDYLFRVHGFPRRRDRAKNFRQKITRASTACPEQGNRSRPDRCGQCGNII